VRQYAWLELDGGMWHLLTEEQSKFLCNISTVAAIRDLGRRGKLTYSISETGSGQPCRNTGGIVRLQKLNQLIRDTCCGNISWYLPKSTRKTARNCDHSEIKQRGRYLRLAALPATAARHSKWLVRARPIVLRWCRCLYSLSTRGRH